MPIPYAQIRTLLAASLDAEGSQRYTDNEDYIPAINYAIDYVTLAFNSIFSQKKLSEEVLKELTYVKVWMPSLYNRIAFDSIKVGMDLWTIIAVYPKCRTVKPHYITPVLSTQESQFLHESYYSGDYSAKRLTLEEWTDRNRNIFSAGSPLISCPDVIQYAWVNFADYTGGYSLANNPFEIEVSPSVVNERVAIAFLKKPIKVIAVTDNIEFPDVLQNLIFTTALKYITFKQNNSKISLYETSSVDQKNIISLLT